MKTYINNTTGLKYLGGTITLKINNILFSGVPTILQLEEWGFVEIPEPEPIPYSPPTENDLKRQRMLEIKDKLQSMDYLTSKYIDGEDMSKYGNWQQERKQLRSEYRQLELEINNY